VVALLGVLKAGGAYLPLDPAYPGARLAFMLRDARVAALVTREPLLERLPPPARPPDVPVVCLDRDEAALLAEPAAGPEVASTARDLVYVFYTSGSTGEPRGVELEHTGIVNEIFWTQRTFGVTPADRASWLSSPAFAVSRWELWPYLTAGACVVVADAETATSPALLRDWLLARGVTIGFVVTALARPLCALDWPPGGALRVMLVGGEQVTWWPPPALPFEVVVSYGITEASSVRVASWPDRLPRRGLPAPPIGRPIANTRVHVLDESGAPVPVGVPGELYIGGEGLARGYRGLPELTARRFVPDPFDPRPDARLYRTGDRARWLPDGTVDFLGRLDGQVKVRGARVEPAEVEAAIVRHPAVRAAAVLARADASGDRRLVAFVAPEASGEGHAAVDAEELRRWAAAELPPPMVPSLFVLLDALPLSLNGKVDRRALSAMPLPRPALRRAFVAPRTPVESAVAALWAELLGVSPVGADDDFFELGGHSLLAARMLARLRDTLGAEVAPRDLFERPTVAAVAAAVAAVGAAAGPAAIPVERGEAERLLAAVDRLDDAQVAALLERLAPGAEHGGGRAGPHA
jgi:amino acid adenylation domain-containing protein